MLFCFGKRNFLVKLQNFSVDFHANETRRAQLVENIFVRAFLLIDNRRKQTKACSFGQGQNLREDLVDALTFDGLAAFRTMRLADSCVSVTVPTVERGLLFVVF